MDIVAINEMPLDAAREAFLRCLGARRWVDAMTARRPFASADDVVAAATEIEASLSRDDWLEAFAAHPQIGDVSTVRQKFAATADWSAAEQAGVGAADEETLTALAEANREYEARFGHTFIVCATGKTAAEMLSILLGRLLNEPDAELQIAAAEQAKVTRLRLEKL